MIITDKVDIRWNNANSKHYKEKGYEFTKNGDTFTISISDLSTGSHTRILVRCDYCDTIYDKSYKDYLKNKAKSITEKDCCKKCTTNKLRDSMINKYGVVSASQLPEFKEKIKETLLNNYGVDSPLKSKEIKEKVINTNLRNYGVEWVSQREDVKQKVKATTNDRYNVDSVLQLEENRIKAKEAMLKKYGHTNPMLVDEFKAKARKTLYENGTAPCSKQQRYIHSVLGGKLNYPFNFLSLDIAFEEEKIYVECDFRGHDLQVRLNNISQDEMDDKECKRYHLLKDDGWRMVRIISKTDKIPYDEVILIMKTLYLNHFGEGHSWIKFDLDKGLIITSKGQEKFDYGKLNKVY